VGSGFRTFTAGEVLTASNVQNYLMDQSVMVFGGSAARSSAIGTANFEEGMVSYLTDTDKVEAYNGTNWVSVAPTTSQGLTLINTTSFSGVTSQSINNVFSATYDVYRLVFVLNESTDGTIILRLRVGGSDNSTASSYTSQFVQGASSSVTSGAETESYWNLFAANTSRSIATYDIAQPFVATPTALIGMGARTGRITSRFSHHNQSTSYDGFSILDVGGVTTLTGYLQVFGYNK